MKTVFMGTPEFAVPALKKLHDSQHEVMAVVTAPDKPAGRGLKVRFSAVKEVAISIDVPVYQPENLKDSEFNRRLRELRADVFVIVAFRILPPDVFNIPPEGTINLHASLLPKYRGAAPINWAIINGEEETGLTTFFIQEKVDTGELILQRKVKIGENETAGELHDRLALLGAQLVLETVDLIERGEAKATPQVGEATRAPKLTKELSQIDWREPAFRIQNLIRGLAPYPAAQTNFNGRLLKIQRAKLTDQSRSGAPGEVVDVDVSRGVLQIATGEGNLQILELQLEGKKKMSVAEFLRGHRIKVGDIFE